MCQRSLAIYNPKALYSFNLVKGPHRKVWIRSASYKQLKKQLQVILHGWYIIYRRCLFWAWMEHYKTVHHNRILFNPHINTENLTNVTNSIFFEWHCRLQLEYRSSTHNCWSCRTQIVWDFFHHYKHLSDPPSIHSLNCLIYNHNTE